MITVYNDADDAITYSEHPFTDEGAKAAVIEAHMAYVKNGTPAVVFMECVMYDGGNEYNILIRDRNIDGWFFVLYRALDTANS